MGRHSTGSQWYFYRSLATWIAPWFLVASLAGAAVWITVSALGEGTQGEPPSQSAATDSPTPTPTLSPTPTPTPTPTKKPPPKKTRKKENQPPPLITAGITVQVLNGTGVADANDRLADRLTALGFDVINLEGANRAYSETTVFWSFPEAEPAARALAARFGWVSAPKPSNLSTQVDLHVVVGADEV